MAEGLLRHDAGENFEVFSAGTKPSQVRSEAIAVMRELGIDISEHRSKSVEEFTHQNFDYVLTVCDSAKESWAAERLTAQAGQSMSGTRKVIVDSGTKLPDVAGPGCRTTICATAPE